MWKEQLGILVILIGGLFLNLWGNDWGLPSRWHPDEHFAADAIGIVWNKDQQTFLTTSLYIKTLASSQFIYHTWAEQAGIVPASFEDIRELARYSVRPGYETDAQYVTASYRLARSLSAIFAAATVVTTYWLGLRLANRHVGLLAALLLTVSMGFMNLAHFATYDMFTIFFVTATVYWSVRIVENGRSQSYLFSAFFAALAASGKAIGFLAIGVLLLAHLLRVLNGRFTNWRQLFLWRSHKKVGLSLICFLASYLLLNPVWLLEPETPIAFLQTVVDYVFNGVDPLNQAAQNFAPRSNWVVGFFNLAETLGWPLFILMSAGLIWALLQAVLKNQQPLIVMLAWVVPYGLFMGASSLPMIAARHMVPLFPLLAVFTAMMLQAKWQRLQRWPQWSTAVLTTAIILYSLAFTAVAATMFRSDSRYAATEWLANNLANEGTILVSGSPTVRSYFPTIPLAAAERILDSRNEADWQLVAEEAPRYIIMSSMYYGRFYAWPTTFPQATRFHNQLINGQLPYTLVAQFPADNPAKPAANAQTIMDFFTPAPTGWLEPQPEFVDPTILIFVRK
jgi:Dolichyl-phosphate-mannose-protein mannosyltransferase